MIFTGNKTDSTNENCLTAEKKNRDFYPVKKNNFTNDIFFSVQFFFFSEEKKLSSL